jgi:hypothetical protein
VTLEAAQPPVHRRTSPSVSVSSRDPAGRSRRWFAAAFRVGSTATPRPVVGLRAWCTAGVFYWEPTWYAVPGNGWNPADIANSSNEWDTVVIFDRDGRLNPTIG